MRKLVTIAAAIAASAITAWFAEPAGAAAPSTVQATASSFSIAGAEPQDNAGSVQNAGDVNGDGRDDLLVVVSKFNGLGTTPISRAYVVFGDGSDAPVDLASLGSRGFVINGPISSVTSFNAAPAGDINGDGLADVIVGDSFATAAGRTHAGRVFVIFGKANTAPVDTDSLGSAGFEVDGSQSEAFASSTSYVKDLNGDGRDELLINEGGIDRATVLYGRTSTATVDLSSIGSAGYRITGPASPGVEYAHRIGDVNGDGLDDLGFTGGCGGVSCPNGRTWVSFGKTDTSAVDLSALGNTGFMLTRNGLADIGPAGDVNGDGKADIAVSDFNASRGYVVFGRTATSTLGFGSLGTAGFQIVSTDQGSILPFGDLDGDGHADLLATSAIVDGHTDAAVIFGKSTGDAVDMADVLDQGFLINGGVTSGGAYTANFGSAPRIAVAFPQDSPLSRDEAGSVRLITPPAPSFTVPSALTYTQGGAIAPMTPRDQRRSSPISWSVTPALPAGLTLDPQTGAIASTPVSATPARAYLIRATDRLGATDHTIILRVDADAYATTAPATGSTTGAQPTFSWQRASAPDNTEPVSRYQVLVDGQTVGELDASQCGPDTCSLTAPAPIADGTHSWRVETTARDGHIRRTADSSFTVVAPPTARLTVTPSAVETDEPVGLDASQSSDPNGGIRWIEFDLDGDGRYETDAGGDPRWSTSFQTIGDHTVRARVTDAGGLTSEASAVVHVTPAPPPGELGVSINDGAIATNNPHVILSLNWPRLAETALLSNDGGFGTAGGTQSVSLAARVPWTLVSSGPERLPKIVYVRFRGGESGRETYTDDIILDQRPPNVAATSLVTKPMAAARASAAAATSSTLRATGTDDNAGIRNVLVATRPGGKPIAQKRLARANARGKRTVTTTVRVPSRLRTVYVRVTDVAGNSSKWKRVRRHTSRR